MLNSNVTPKDVTAAAKIVNYILVRMGVQLPVETYKQVVENNANLLAEAASQTQAARSIRLLTLKL